MRITLDTENTKHYNFQGIYNVNIKHKETVLDFCSNTVILLYVVNLSGGIYVRSINIISKMSNYL